MAKALECPACGARHPLDSLPDARTFRCDRCGQVLKVPEAIDALRAATVPRAPAGTDGPPPPPPRRGRATPTGASVSATATATVPAVAPSPGDTRRGRDVKRTPAPRRRKARWYWRVVAWVVAIPLGLLVTGWPALHFDLLNKDDLLDVFVGSGTGRYLQPLLFAAAWALVTALLVQLLVEGGRWWSARRARVRAAAA